MNDSTYVIWDPNGLNPYGQEVAAVLAESASSIHLWIPSTAKVVLGQGTNIALRPVLASTKRQDGFVAHVGRRILMPVLVAIQCLVLRRTLLIVWNRGFIEAAIFAVVAKFAVVMTVHHNPVASRTAQGLEGAAFRRLLRFSAVVLVHSDSFVDSAGMDLRGSVRVVGHPSYRAWSRQMALTHGPRESGRRETNLVRLLFLGAVRPDKGPRELANLIRLLESDGVEIAIVGQGPPPSELVEQVAKQSVNVCIDAPDGGVSDDRLYGALLWADLLVAPYVQATVSGTVIMAATVGLDVIAFDSGSLREVLTEGALVHPNVEDMVAQIRTWSTSSFGTLKASENDLHARAVETWGLALGSGAGRRSR